VWPAACAAHVVMPVNDEANSAVCRIPRAARHAREGKLVTGDNVQKSGGNCNKWSSGFTRVTHWADLTSPRVDR